MRDPDPATSVSIGRSYRARIVKACARTGWLQREIVEMAIDSIDLSRLPVIPSRRALVREALRNRNCRRAKRRTPR